MGRCLSLTLCIALIVVALITVGVGFLGHLVSEWRGWRSYENTQRFPNYKDGLHNFCDEDYPRIKREREWEKSHSRQAVIQAPKGCPDIALEKVFLAFAVICLLGAILSVLLACMDKGNNKALKLANAILQAVLALLICIGAILFIVSAVQAQQNYDFIIGLQIGRIHVGGSRESDAREIGMRYEIKLGAGAVGILQAVLHAVAACVIMKMRGSGNAPQFQPQPMDSQISQQSNVQPDPNATNQGQGPQAQAAT